MGFQSTIKRMFGFSVEDLDDDTDINLNTVDSQLIPTLQPSADAPAPPATTLTTGPLPEDMPVEVIDGILSVVNESLPPLVKECLDKNAQRTRLYEAMGEQFKQYVARLATTASAEAQNAVSGDRSRLQTELEQLKTERKNLEQKREEQKEQILSEQRQRRALTERVRDLESKLNSYDAEKEQYQIEIKSLMNKIRASEVREGDDEELKKRIDELQTQMKAMHEENADLKAQLSNREQEVNELEAKVSELESAVSLSEAVTRVSADAAGEYGETQEDAAPAAPKKRRGRPRKSQPTPAVDPDDDIANVDWLLPGGSPSAGFNNSGESDFGYQPPQRSNFHEDDNQPTLF